MRNKKVTKLWKGQYVSIRDYELEQAKNSGGIVIEHKSEKMTLGLDRLNVLKPSSRLFKSKTGGRSYRLVDVVFEPDFINEKQDGLF